MIDVSVDMGDIREKLSKLKAGIESDRVLNGVATIAVDGIQGGGGIFDDEGIQGGPMGSILWEQSKAARTENRKTLHKSGHLRRSVHRTNAAGGEVKVGTTAVYGAIHQFGGFAGKDKKTELPARPFIGINRETQKRIADYLEEYLAKSMR